MAPSPDRSPLRRCALLSALILLAVCTIVEGQSPSCDGVPASTACPCIAFGPAQDASARVTSAANPKDTYSPKHDCVSTSPGSDTSYSCSDWQSLQKLLASKGDGICVLNVVLNPGQTYDISGVQFEVLAGKSPVMFTAAGSSNFGLSSQDSNLAGDQATSFKAAADSQLTFQGVSRLRTGGSDVTQFQNVRVSFVTLSNQVQSASWQHTTGALSIDGSTLVAGQNVPGSSQMFVLSGPGSSGATLTATGSTFDLPQAWDTSYAGVKVTPGSGNVKLTSCKFLGAGSACEGVFISGQSAGAGVVIEGNSFSGLNYGVFIDPGVSSLVTVKGSTFTGGNYGVSQAGSSRVTVDQSTFMGQVRTAIISQVSFDNPQPLIVSRSTLAGPKFGFQGSASVVPKDQCTRRITVVFDTCTLSGIAFSAIQATRMNVQVLSSTIANTGIFWGDLTTQTCDGNTIGGLYLANSIVSGPACASNPSGAPVDLSGGNNIVQKSFGDLCSYQGTGQNTLSYNVNLRLGGLQDNGGPTRTRELTQGSPAIGFSTDCSGARQFDQRGIQRKLPRCDSGAYENEQSDKFYQVSGNIPFG